MMHRAARIEDWLHEKREKFARRRGHNPIVIPYTGYGSTERVRILCRVLLAKPVKPGSQTGRRASCPAGGPTTLREEDKRGKEKV